MARSLETLRGILRGATYNQIGAMLTSGRVTESELRKFYSEERKIATKRAARLGKAGLTGVDSNFRKIQNLTTTQDLVHEIADVNRFIKGKTTVTARRAEIKQKLETMHNRNMFLNVDESNFSVFTRFMDWARNTSRLERYSSESDEIELTFDTVINTGASTAAEFEELFLAVTGGV